MYNYLEIQDDLCLVRTLPIKSSISCSLDLHEVLHFHVKVYFLYVVSHPVENFLLIWRRHHCQWRSANLDLHCMISGDSLASNTYMYCKKRHPYDDPYDTVSLHSAGLNRFVPLEMMCGLYRCECRLDYYKLEGKD